MPIYEYHCQECGRDFETLVLKEGEAVACPACGSRRVGRQLSCFARGNGGPQPLAPAAGGGCGGKGGGFS